MSGRDTDDTSSVRVDTAVSSNTRSVLWELPTAYPPVPLVTMYVSTNELHIKADRKLGAEENVSGTLIGESTVVVKGTTNEGYLAFVNPTVTSPNKGSPFVVIVDPDGDPKPAIASYGYRKDFKDLEKHEKLWPPPPKK